MGSIPKYASEPSEEDQSDGNAGIGLEGEDILSKAGHEEDEDDVSLGVPHLGDDVNAALDAPTPETSEPESDGQLQSTQPISATAVARKQKNTKVGKGKARGAAQSAQVRPQRVQGKRGERKNVGSGVGGSKRSAWNKQKKMMQGKDGFWKDMMKVGKEKKDKHADASSSAEEWHSSESSVSMQQVEDFHSSDLEEDDQEALDAKYFREFLAYARRERYPDPVTIPRFADGKRVPTELDTMLCEDDGEDERWNNDMIFLAGGYFGPVVSMLEKPRVLSHVERYSPHEQGRELSKWRGAPEMLSPRSAHALCALRGRIYAIGGQAHDGGDVSIGGVGPIGGEPLSAEPLLSPQACEPVRCKEPYYDLDTVESIQVFPSRENTWRPEPSIAGKRIGLAAAAMSGRIYISGGYNGVEWLDTVESYGQGDSRWRKEPSMTTQRHGHGMAALGDGLYAVGGHDWVETLDSVESFHLGSQQWVLGPAMRRRRHYLAVAACPITGRIYALGGFAIKRIEEWEEQLGKYVPSAAIDYDTQTSVESLDPREGRWRVEPSMNTRRIYHSAAACGATLYAIGGCDVDGAPSDTVEILDLRMPRRWELSASLQINRTYTAAAVVSHDAW